MAQIRFLPDWLLKVLVDTHQKTKIWLVGGAIRDRLLGLEPMDYDFAVKGEAREAARNLANRLGGHYFDLDRERDAGRVILHDTKGRYFIDFARLRGEGIEDDLFSRDFTINALGIDLSESSHLIDPTGGLQDLKDPLLSACGSTSIEADPVRSLRAIRLSFQFDLQIDGHTLQQIRAFSPSLHRVSAERIRDEFFCIIDLPRPGRAFRLMDHLGLLSILFPELDALRGLQQSPPHEFTAWEHTLAVVDQLGVLLEVLARSHDPKRTSELIWGEIAFRLGRFRAGINDHLEQEIGFGRTCRQLLFFVALLHDIGKPTCFEIREGRIRFIRHEQVGADLSRSRAEQLRLSKAEIQWLERVIRHHMRPAFLEREKEITRRAIYRFFQRVGEAGIDVVLLSLADLLGKQNPPMNLELLSARVEVAKKLLSAYIEPSDIRFDLPALVRGNELADALGITPGPEIGRMMAEIEEARYCGEIATQEEALELARKLHSKRSDVKRDKDEEGEDLPDD